MLVLLHINGIELDFTDDDLVKLGLGLADGSIDAPDTPNWINTHRRVRP